MFLGIEGYYFYNVWRIRLYFNLTVQKEKKRREKKEHFSFFAIYLAIPFVKIQHHRSRARESCNNQNIKSK